MLCALACGGVPGDFPFYTMAQSLSLFGVVERFEPIVSMGLTAGGFCLLALLCRVNGRAFEVLLPRAGGGFAAGVNFIGGCLGMWLAERLPAAALAGGTAIFWGLLPIGTLLVGNRKKSQKIEKKC